MEPYAVGAVSRVDVCFWFGSSSKRTAYPAAREIASVMTTNCLQRSGWRGAGWQERSNISLFSLSCFIVSGLIRVLALAFFGFRELEERSYWFHEYRYIVMVVFQKSNVALKCFLLISWKFGFFKKMAIFCSCGATPLILIMRLKKSTCCSPKWQSVLLR